MNEQKDVGGREIYRTAQLTGDIISWEDMCQAQSSDQLNARPIVTECTHNHLFK